MVGAGAAAGTAAMVGLALGARSGPQEPPESQLGGSERHYTWRGHRIFYATRGSGPRLVFVHSIHAAGNSFEWRQNFRALGDRFEVFALDLLGFGKSDRPALDYTARLYVDLLADFVRDVAGGGATVAASSLSGAHAIQAAAEAPEAVTALVLAGPTGATRLTLPAGAAGRATEAFFRSPVVGEAAFNALVSKAGIRFFLKRQTYGAAARVTPEIVDYYYRSSHQPGARFAPAAFVGQALNLDAREAFAALRQPVVLVYGAESTIVPPPEGEAFRRINPSARLEIVPGAGALVHEGRPEVFNEIVRTLATTAGIAPIGMEAW